jgi:sugar porter (SP) family MFS transporter
MSEIAPRKVRGALVSGYQFCITIGILIANGAVYSTKNRNDTGSYRIPIGIQFIWALILALGLFFLPESPRYYVKKDRLDDAAKALASVRGQPIESEYIQDELAEIVANHKYEQSVIPDTSYFGSWAQCFTGSLTNGSSNIRRTLLGILLQMMQQLTGINFIFYFGNVFLTSLGTIHNPFLISILSALINTLCTPLAFYAVDRWGRRTLLIWGSVGMISSQFIVGIVGVTAGKLSAHNNPAVSSMIAFIMINVAIFSFTWGPVAWVSIGEIFPLPIRSRGVGLSTASNWMWNCVSSLLTHNSFPFWLTNPRSLVSSPHISSGPLKATRTLARRSTSCGVLCASSPSHSPTSLFLKQKASPSSKSIVCWRRLRHVHPPSGCLILLSQLTWDLPIRSRTAAPRSSTSKQMRSPPFRSVVRSVIYILDYT